MSTKISVIMPIYGVEKYIGNSIKSLTTQTFDDFEVILVDDGTYDASIEIATDILKYSKLKYKIITQKNQGVSAARNNGIKQAHGDWIVCVDPDDVINDQFLEILYMNAINMDVQVSICNYQMVNDKNVFKLSEISNSSNLLTQKQVLYGYLVKELRIISPAMLIHRNLIYEKNLWYDEDMKFSEDMHFIWRTLLSINEISYSDNKLYNYLRRDGSTMTSANLEKAKSGYDGFAKLDSDIDFRFINVVDDTKFIFPRWVIGVLRTSARTMKYSDFKTLAIYMKYKINTRKLIGFPDYKIKILSLILRSNLWIFYKFNKRL